MKKHYDAIVIGSGVGGCCAAALLAYSGRRVLLAEKRSHVGGRFSTVNRDGFLCATGGLAIQTGGCVEQVCDAVGIQSGVRPSQKVATWLDGKIYDHKNGGTSRIIREVATSEAEAERVLGALKRARGWYPPSNDISFEQWLNQFTDNKRIHGIFQATISSLLTVNINELPAGEYFTVMEHNAPITFGFIEGGSIQLWEKMAKLVELAGGDVMTGAAAKAIHTKDHKVTGVDFRHQQQDYHVTAPIVVSNVGPAATNDLLPPDMVEMSYRRQLDRVSPTAIMWLHFSSPELLMEYSALAVGCSRRVNMIDVPSFEAEGVAPPGQHLYTVGGAPLDSLNPTDIKAEFEALMEDLREIFPGFDERAKVLTKTCYRGDWPGFRTISGSRPGHRTPVMNLYNVGDGAGPSGFEGSMGAAKSALMVADDVQQFGPAL